MFDLSNIDIDFDSLDMDLILKDNFFLEKTDLSDKYSTLFLKAKTQLEYFIGLDALTRDKEWKNISVFLKNKAIERFFVAKFRYHQEMVLQQFYGKESHHKGQLLTMVEAEESRLETQKMLMNKHPEGSKEYLSWKERIAIMQRTVESAKAKLKVIDFAERTAESWQPPTFEDLKPFAKGENIYYSEALTKYEKSMKHTHLLPDWVIEYAKYFNLEHKKYVDPNADVNPRDFRWIEFTRRTLQKENNNNKHFDLMVEALEKYWSQVTIGFKDIEDKYLDRTIEDYLKDFSGELVELNQANLNVSTMGGFFDDLLKVVLSPVQMFATSFAKKVLDKTVGKVIPSKYYAPLSKLTEVQVAVLQGKLDKEQFRKAVEATKDVGKFAVSLQFKLQKISVELWRDVAREVTGTERTFKDIDRYTGGLITSYERLNKTAAIVVDSEGKAKVDWRVTLIDAMKIGAVVAGGSFVSVLVTTGVNAVADKTNLDETTWGRYTIEVGRAYVLGGPEAISKVAVKKGVMIGADEAGITKTKLGRELAMAGAEYVVSEGQTAGAFAKNYSQQRGKQVAVAQTEKKVARETGSPEVGAAFGASTSAAIGPVGTQKAIDNNSTFSERFKKVAKSKSVEIARKRADEKLKEKVGFTTRDIERVYNLRDKKVQDIIDEAKSDYQKGLQKIKDRANADYLKGKLEAETDRFIQKRIDETYNTVEKYGQDFLRYLMWKYGPQWDYDRFIVPNDYLMYQIYIIPPNQRLFPFDYDKMIQRRNAFLALVGTIVAGGGYVIANS